MRALGGVKLAAIGPATAETLAKYRLKADLVPTSYRSEALAESLAKVAAGSRILLARADRGRAVLKELLAPVATVEEVAVYRNRDVESLPVEVARRLEEGSVDWVTVTSPAIVARLHALLGEAAQLRVGHSIRLASISPVTTEAARGLGWAVAAEAVEATGEGLVAAIVRAERGRV
jgi:uroporphyrinogen III methyltransferase/synthase